MEHFREIDTCIWNDEKFNLLSDDGKLIFFLLLTHPHLLPIGAMRGTIYGLASEIHWSLERFQNGFNEVLNHELVKYDAYAALIWLPHHMHPLSHHLHSYDEYFDYLPDCVLKNELLNAIKKKGFFSTTSITKNPFFLLKPTTTT